MELYLILIIVVVAFVTFTAILRRYKRCPSDKILVIYGKTGKAKAIRFSTLEAICRALDCQPGDLLEYRSD